MPIRLIANDGLKFNLITGNSGVYPYFGYTNYYILLSGGKKYGGSSESNLMFGCEYSGPINECFVPFIKMDIIEIDVPYAKMYDNSSIDAQGEVKRWIEYSPKGEGSYRKFYTKHFERYKVCKIYVDVNKKNEGCTDGSKEHPFRYFASAMDAAIIWSGVIHLIGIDTICIHVKGTVTETPYACSFTEKQTSCPIIIEGEEDTVTFSYSSYYKDDLTSRNAIFPFFPVVFKDCKIVIENITYREHYFCSPYCCWNNKIAFLDDISRTLVFLSRGKFSRISSPLNISSNSSLFNYTATSFFVIEESEKCVIFDSFGSCRKSTIPYSQVWHGSFTRTIHYTALKEYNCTGNGITHDIFYNLALSSSGKVYLKGSPFYFKQPDNYSLRNIASTGIEGFSCTFMNSSVEASFIGKEDRDYYFISGYFFNSKALLNLGKNHALKDPNVLFDSTFEMFNTSLNNVTNKLNGGYFSYRSILKNINFVTAIEPISIFCENSKLEEKDFYIISGQNLDFSFDFNGTFRLLDSNNITIRSSMILRASIYNSRCSILNSNITISSRMLLFASIYNSRCSILNSSSGYDDLYFATIVNSSVNLTNCFSLLETSSSEVNFENCIIQNSRFSGSDIHIENSHFNAVSVFDDSKVVIKNSDDIGYRDSVYLNFNNNCLVSIDNLDSFHLADGIIANNSKISGGRIFCHTSCCDNCDLNFTISCFVMRGDNSKGIIYGKIYHYEVNSPDLIFIPD